MLETLSAMRSENDVSLVDEVAKRYKEILDSEDKTVSVTMTTAVPMDDQLREKVRARAEKVMNAPFILLSALTRIMGGVLTRGSWQAHGCLGSRPASHISKTFSSAFMGGED